ncbi:hypothetical protein DPSP01_001833, partial [Paraphaeosphaeria sporulosa]
MQSRAFLNIRTYPRAIFGLAISDNTVGHQLHAYNFTSGDWVRIHSSSFKHGSNGTFEWLLYSVRDAQIPR